MAKNVLVLNGPNLNMLGIRETETYGSTTLDEITKRIDVLGTKLELDVESFQSNHEGVLIDRVHASSRDGVDFVLINPGALTHTSVALRDSFLAIDIPFIELHLSNVHAREAFRTKSFLSDIAVGVIAGFGAHSYELALMAAHRWLQENS